MQSQPPLKIAARVEGLFSTPRIRSLETVEVDLLELGFDGIFGDRHGGATRKSGGREPWYPRGTQIRNERQVSLLSPDDLEAVAVGMNLPELRPEWIGGNLLISGIKEFSLLPPRTCLFFAGGVTIRIDGSNIPCRLSGRSVAAQFPASEGLDLMFVRAAHQLRGLVGWVEKPGVVRKGEILEARVPEQRIYRG